MCYLNFVMNDKQKWFVVVAVGSFLFWLVAPFSGDIVSDGMKPYLDLFDIFNLDLIDFWFVTWYQVLSFSISGFSLTGYFLFKDK